MLKSAHPLPDWLAALPQVTSTQAKQSFGELVEAAMRAPVAVGKHGKIKVVVATPDHMAKAGEQRVLLAERRTARANQALVEKDRLIKHLRIGMELLTLPAAQRRARIQQARAVTDMWRAKQLCSADLIDRWQAILALPAEAMAQAMGSDLDGWGPALRQNSPWVGEAKP